MSRWGKQGPVTSNISRRHPDLEDLPPLPRDFEESFMTAAVKFKDLANSLKEQGNKATMQHFGGGMYNNNSSNGNGDEGGRSRQTVNMLIPAHRAGLVIGHHGESLKRIEKMSQCKVQFDQQFSSDQERRVIIVGFPEDIEEAKRLVMERVEDPMARFPTVQIKVPQARVGLIIGKGGETIRELQEKSGAKVAVQPESEGYGGSGERIVNVCGDDTSIQRAREMINDLLSGNARSGFLGVSQGGSNLNAHGSSSVLTTARNATTIQIPETCVGAIIGKRAETLKTLQSMSGCRIYVEPNPSPEAQRTMGAAATRPVHLTGAPEQIAYAQQMIMERVAMTEGAYYGNYDQSAQPSVIYQNPGEFSGGMGGGAAVDPNTQAGYDYAQYYYYYQQQQAMAAQQGQSGQMDYLQHAMAQQGQQQPGQMDYSAYYNNQAVYQQQPPPPQ